MTPTQSHSHDEYPELIAATANGTVRRCRDCGTLHLRFGNAVLSLHTDDLQTLREALVAGPNSPRALSASPASPAAAHTPGRRAERAIEIHIGDAGAGFAFNIAELWELDGLLSSAAGRIAALLAADEWVTLPAPIARRIGERRHTPTGRSRNARA